MKTEIKGKGVKEVVTWSRFDESKRTYVSAKGSTWFEQSFKILHWIFFNSLHFSVTEAKEVFELFDFWDGRDAEVDASKIGDVIRCVGLNPTLEIVKKNGGTDKMGRYL